MLAEIHQTPRRINHTGSTHKPRNGQSKATKSGQVEYMTSKPVKRLVVTLGTILLMLGAGYVLLLAIGFMDPNACISETKGAIPDLSGARFEIIYTNCDTLAKDEAISVFISRSAVSRDSWFAKLRSRRSLVFRYDPGRPDNPLPHITNPSKSAILISVPEVSSIFYQNQRWQGLSIDYAIGKVDYPKKPK